MNFDRLAPHYRWMECLLAGGKLQRARTAWLSSASPVHQALLVGEGNGRFLTAALAAWPDAQFHCVDASAAMLSQVRDRLSPAEHRRVRFEVARLPEWAPSRARFDMLVTHFFLDCFPPRRLRRVMQVIADAGTSDAAWLVADFVIPERSPARERAKLIHGVMYLFFRAVTGLEARSLTPPEPVFSDLGFVRTWARASEWGLLRSSVWRRRRAGAA